MKTYCPLCGSHHVQTKNKARKLGGAIGTASGATGAIVAARKGAAVGSHIGLWFGPTGSSIGGITGAIISAFIGGFTGGSVGIRLGELIDNNILDNFECDSCGAQFSESDQYTPYNEYDEDFVSIEHTSTSDSSD